MKSGKLTASKSTTKNTNKWLDLLERYEWAVVILIFFATLGIFYAVNNYSHVMTNFFDEYYYLEIAKSIYHGTGIRVRDIPFGFQNILYSAIIAPFMGIANPVLRINMLTLFNTFLFTSSIFPIWLITRKLKLGLPYRYLALLLAIISPMQVYSTSYMTEILYYPMIIWFVYVWLINKEKQHYIVSFLIGVFCYALFLCKEIAIFPLIIIVAFELFYPLVEKLLDHDSYLPFSDYYHWKNLLNPVLYLVGFFMFFTIFKLTLFKGVGEFYHHTDPSVIDSVGKFFYLFYAALYFVLGICLLAFFIPVIYPFFCYKKMNKHAQYAFVFAIVMIVIAAVTCAYTVSIREDFVEYNPITPRVIARYSMPSIMLLFIVFLYTLENRKKFLFDLSKGQKKGLFISLISLLGLFIFVFKGAPLGALSGTILPSYYVYYQDLINNNINRNPLLRYSMFVIFNILIAGIVYLIHYLLLPKQKRYMNLISVATITATLLTTLICYEQYYFPLYCGEKDKINEAVRIENFLNTLSHDTTVLLPVSANRRSSRYINTYLSDMHKVLVVDYMKLDDVLPGYGEKEIKVSSITFYETLLDYKYEQKDSIEYIIIPDSARYMQTKFTNVEIVTEHSTDTLKIYRNLTSQYLTIE